MLNIDYYKANENESFLDNFQVKEFEEKEPNNVIGLNLEILQGILNLIKSQDFETVPELLFFLELVIWQWGLNSEIYSSIDRWIQTNTVLLEDNCTIKSIFNMLPSDNIRRGDLQDYLRTYFIDAYYYFLEQSIKLDANQKSMENDLKRNKSHPYFLNADDFEVNPPDYIINEQIEQNKNIGIFGQPSAGKSLYALYLSCCIACNHSDNNLTVIKPGPVLYVNGEGLEGLARRLNAWREIYKKDSDRIPLYFTKAPAQLTVNESVDFLCNEIKKIRSEVGEPLLIIFDTLNRNFGPGDENLSSDMSAVVQALDQIRTSNNGLTTIVIHHTGHKDRYRPRGSSVLSAALDMEFCIEKKDDVIIVKNTKNKDAEVLPPKSFKIEVVEFDLGCNQKSYTAATLRSLNSQNVIPRKLGKNQEYGLRVLYDLISRYEIHNIEIQVWRAEMKSVLKDPQRFTEVRKGLLQKGLIKIEETRVFLTDKALKVISQKG